MWGICSSCQVGPATDQEVGGDEGEGKDRYCESTGGREAYAGVAEEKELQERPDGKGGGGVKVSGDVPMAEEEVANGSVAVPALVGVLGPVHPGGVVGEV